MTHTLPPAFSALGEYNQFILCKLVPDANGGKPAKVPISASSGLNCNAQDPAHWLSFAHAATAARLLGCGFGFVLTKEDPFFCVDVDNAWDGEKWSDTAQAVFASFPGAAFEISQSGTGFHLFGKYTAAVEHSMKRVDLGVEFYTGGRYIWLTFTNAAGGWPDLQAHFEAFAANWFPPTAATPAVNWVDEAVPEYRGPEGDTDLINKMLLSRPSFATLQGEAPSILELWTGAETLGRFYPDNSQGRAFDNSSADLALCTKLAFWTGKNPERIERLFRVSGLVRDKWLEREKYRITTIEKAIGFCSDVLGSAQQPAVSGIDPCAENANDEFWFDLSSPAWKPVSDQIPLAGEFLKRKFSFALGQDRRLYRFVHGRYKPDGERWVAKWLRPRLRQYFRKRHLTELLEWLRAEEPKITERPPENVINCANGLLDWQNLDLKDHSPTHYSPIRIPIRWRPDAKCPEIDRVLHELLPNEVVPLIYEIAGYCLYPANPMRKAFMFLGGGRNGKSTVLNLIGAMLGRENCTAIPIQTLSDNRFAAAQLFGKLANIAGDLDARSIKRSDTFKCLTGGDEIQAEHKFKDSFRFRSFATLLFSANEPPLSSDQTSAWFDRWIIIDFKRRLAETEVDPHLEAKLHTESELEGFLVHAVAGQQRLMARGRFDLPEVVREAGDEYRLRLNSVRAFIEEECSLKDPNARTTRKRLYASYVAWCETYGRRPVSEARLCDQIRGAFGDRISETKVNGTRGWKGIIVIAPTP